MPNSKKVGQRYEQSSQQNKITLRYFSPVRFQKSEYKTV